MQLQANWSLLLVLGLVACGPGLNRWDQDFVDTAETDTDTDTDTDPPAASLLRAEDGHFRDPAGRVVLLRGINVAGNSKVPPYLPIGAATDLDPLQDWGLNVVRLLVNWEAYETSPGVYDDVYLTAITDAADAAWARGVYVVIDFHQDGFSRYLAGGCGDGFPQWAHPSSMSLDTPDNGAACVNWGVQMTLDARVHDAFGAFYADTDGNRTRFLALWTRLAAHFSTHEGVIGYDVINEPWGWEDSELLPLYEDAAVAIRGQHPDAILFIEGHVTTNGGTQSSLPQPSFDNFAWSPHFYEGLVLQTHIWSGLTTVTDNGFNTMNARATDWNVPLFIGEFGTHGDTWNGKAYVDLQYERMNDHFASGAQWNYTPGWDPTHKDGWNDEDLSVTDDTGTLRPNFRPRGYPRAIAGRPTALSETEDELVLTWTHEPAKGATELFFPDASPTVQESGPGLGCTWDAASRVASCTSATAGAMTVTITR